MKLVLTLKEAENARNKENNQELLDWNQKITVDLNAYKKSLHGLEKLVSKCHC